MMICQMNWTLLIGISMPIVLVLFGKLIREFRVHLRFLRFVFACSPKE